MTVEKKIVNKFNIKDYQELIDTLAKVEYKKLSSKHLIDFFLIIDIFVILCYNLFGWNI